MAGYIGSVKISGTSKYPTLTFEISNPGDYHYTSPVTWSTLQIQCPQMCITLKCWFLHATSKTFYSELTFHIKNNDADTSIKSAIIFMDYKIKQSNFILALKNDIVHKVFPLSTSFQIDECSSTDPFSSRIPTIYLEINLKFVHIFDYTSALYFCFGPPSKALYFHFLNSKDISNVSFKLQSKDQVIWVNKQIMCKECAFFDKMLQKEWVHNDNEDDNHNHVEVANWSDQVLIAIILHLYTGWLPGTPICKEVYKKFNIEESEFFLDSNSWPELYETAIMLELFTLAFFAALETKKCFSTKIDSFLFKK